MWFRAGADLVVVVHLLFIAFVIGGAFPTWRWHWITWLHIPAAVYGVLVEFAGLTCPLTVLENNMRSEAWEAGYVGGFIDHYLIKVIYPPGLTHEMQIGLGVLVLIIAIIGYWGLLRRLGWISAWREPRPKAPAAYQNLREQSALPDRYPTPKLMADRISKSIQHRNLPTFSDSAQAIPPLLREQHGQEPIGS